MTTTPFKAPRGLQNRHVQTIFSTLFHRKQHLPFIYEEFLLSDGDQLELFWTPNKNQNAPLLILIPGIAGSLSSPYIERMMCKAYKQGFKVVCFQLRGFTQKLKTKKIYHAGFTHDLEEFISSYTQNQNAFHQIHIIGYSIGSNILLKWLAESSQATQTVSSVAVSVPFDLLNTVQNVDKGFSKIYQKAIMKEINKVMRLNFNFKKDFKKIYDFDEQITSQWHGYKDAKDYYHQNSSKNFLTKIKTPTLILQARDDPFVSECMLPQKEMLSPSIQFELSENGGHVGFIAGKSFFKPEYWMEDRILNYLTRGPKRPSFQEPLVSLEYKLDNILNDQI